MSNDKTVGGLILIGSLAGIALYFWLLFMSAWSLITIQISAFAAVTMVFLIIAWIGYTLATTPPPTPLEEIDLNDISDDATDLDK